MPRFFARLAVLPLVIFSVTLLLIRAQPYDDHELRELLLPEGCPAPCFMGIRPGVTTMDEAMKILESSGWVDSIDDLVDNSNIGFINWNWNNQKPKMITQNQELINQDIQGQLWVNNNVVVTIIFHTNYLLGDTRIVFGIPSLEGSGKGSSDLITNKIPAFYNAHYEQIGLSILTWDYCPANKPKLLEKKVTILLSLPVSLQPRQTTPLNVISQACR